MKNHLKGWLTGIAVCLSSSCDPMSFTGNGFTSLFVLALCLGSVIFYELVFVKKFLEILKMLEQKKQKQPDLKTLELKLEHHGIRMSMLAKILSGQEALLITQLQQEKFDAVDMLNEARKIAATSKPSKESKTSNEKMKPSSESKETEIKVATKSNEPKVRAEQAIQNAESLISKLDAISETLRNKVAAIC